MGDITDIEMLENLESQTSEKWVVMSWPSKKSSVPSSDK